MNILAFIFSLSLGMVPGNKNKKEKKMKYLFFLFFIILIISGCNLMPRMNLGGDHTITQTFNGTDYDNVELSISIMNRDNNTINNIETIITIYTENDIHNIYDISYNYNPQETKVFNYSIDTDGYSYTDYKIHFIVHYN